MMPGMGGMGDMGGMGVMGNPMAMVGLMQAMMARQAQGQAQGKTIQEAVNFRPGDWVCLECNFHNYASRDSCHNCGRGKRPSASSVDYVDAAGGGEYHGIRPAEHQGVVSRWPDSDSHALTLRRAM